MSETKNVLLCCVSLLRANSVESEYDTGLGESIKAISTNEAPAKTVILGLLKDGNKKLDKVVMICSQKVREEKIKEIKNEKGVTEEANMLMGKRFRNGKLYDDLTHLEYLKESISEFADEKYAGEEHKIDFEIIEVSDDPDGMECSKAAVEAAKKVVGDNEKANLFIDYNGGQRYMALMMLSISNLLKLHNVVLKDVYTMNYEFRPIRLQKMPGVFKSMDLVAGINEFINYGRAKLLTEYFSVSASKGIKKVLNIMTQFANALQLCDVKNILSGAKKLNDKFEEYAKDAETENDTYEVLFKYTVMDIKREYSTIFSGYLPDIILWCLEKDFIQQALTLYVERMPIFLYENRLYYPSENNERIYNEFYKENKENRDYKGYDKKYSWFTKYIPKMVIKDQKNNQQTEALKRGEAKSKAEHSDVDKIMKNYFYLKNVRNQVNHASEMNNTDSKYDDIKRKLKSSVEFIKKLNQQ